MTAFAFSCLGDKRREPKATDFQLGRIDFQVRNCHGLPFVFHDAFCSHLVYFGENYNTWFCFVDYPMQDHYFRPIDSAQAHPRDHLLHGFCRFPVYSDWLSQRGAWCVAGQYCLCSMALGFCDVDIGGNR